MAANNNKLPRQLKAFNVYQDGESYAGRCDTFTLPAMAFLIEEHRAGGMDAPVPIELGMEMMSATFILSDNDDKFFKLMGKDNVPLVLRGGIQAQGKDPEPVVVNLRGMLISKEDSEWVPGQKSTTTYTMALRYFRYRQNAVQLCEIDIINMVRDFGGDDQLKKLRNAIGM